MTASFLKTLAALVLLLGLIRPLTAEDTSKPITRLAFGSCAHQDDPQPIWEAIVAARPEVFLIIGDSIYHDVVRNKRARAESLAEKYAKAKSFPAFQRLLQSALFLGTWDDHDYGRNDAGSEYPHKKEAQQAFLDFLGVPKDSPRRQMEGVYNAHVLGPPEQRVQIILLDTRYFRGPLKKRDKFLPREGPYDPNPDKTSSMLGETQWQWLAEQFKVPAKVRLLVSSIQLVAQDHHHEKWLNLPHERERLFKLLQDTNAKGVLCLSGDRHLAELSMMDAGLGYPLYDLTSSGLTMGFKGWRPLESNRHRVATMNKGNNFGMVLIEWGADPVLRLQIRGEDGEVMIQEKVRLSTLQAGKWKSKGTSLVRLEDGYFLTPDRVKALVYKKVTLELQVHGSGVSKATDLVFLNSASDRNSDENVTIVLDSKGQQALKERGIDSPRTHFEGKSIRVTGTLSLFRERPQIIVSDAAQIRVVGK